MCGLVGAFAPRSRRSITRRELEAMLAPLLHRGPDGVGFHEAEGVGLGFCRLAIVDLETGDQPMASEDGALRLVFNGEIYNHLELRRELTGRGHRFRTRSDSETILHAYAEWGDACVSRLRGMFAFCVSDARARRLLLARDRSGIKPLYLARRAGDLCFASEAKALLVDPGSERRIDLRGFYYADELEPGLLRSPFAGVLQLAPGHLLIADELGERAHAYWRYQPSSAVDGGDERALVEAFGAELNRAVFLHLQSDVPVGLYLSGGIDSSSIAAAIRAAGREDVTAYCGWFDEQSSDARYAERCLAHLGLAGRFVHCPSDATLLDRLPLVAWLAEGDFDLGYVSRLQLAEAAHADGVKVVLAGQGADEALAGYHPSYAEFIRWAARAQLGHRDAARAVTSPPFADGALLSVALGDDPTGERRASTASRELASMHGLLANTLLRFEDRMGMAVGVEVRVPFLDHVLLELCASVPDRLRASLFSGKALLRRAVAALLPREILERPKLAFNATTMPLTRTLLAARSELLDLISPRALRDRGYFDEKACRVLLDERRFVALDRVFVVQLLDELFVQRFDPGRFAARRSALTPELVSDAAPPARECESVGADDVPSVAAAVARIRSELRSHLEGPALAPAELAEIDLVYRGSAPVVVAYDLVEVLKLVDGRRTWRDICRELDGGAPLEELLEAATSLHRRGVLDHLKRLTASS